MEEAGGLGWRFIHSVTAEGSTAEVKQAQYTTVLQLRVNADGSPTKTWEVATLKVCDGKEEWTTCWQSIRGPIKDVIDKFNAETLLYNETRPEFTFDELCKLYKFMNGVELSQNGH
jgi:hypothetical protein